MLIITLLTILVGKHFAISEYQIRALAFVSLIINNLALIFANLSWSSSLAAILKKVKTLLYGVRRVIANSICAFCSVFAALILHFSLAVWWLVDLFRFVAWKFDLADNYAQVEFTNS